MKVSDCDVSQLIKDVLDENDFHPDDRLDLLKNVMHYAEIRICDVCHKAMTEGYYDGDYTGKYFCSDECLHTEMTDEEWHEHYSDDGQSYYTEWEGVIPESLRDVEFN